MQTYLAILMTLSGFIGFFVYANADNSVDRGIAKTALMVASALLSAVVALGLRG